VHWLAGEPPRHVLDLGAGTGKLTRQLTAAGHRVVAVEPAVQMLAHLRDALPDVTALVGDAEDIPLADASVDVVVVAQAYHWFDHARAVPEIARVLRPGGVLGLIWNSRDESATWVARLSKLIGSESLDDWELEETLDAGRFEPLEKATFGFVQRLDKAGLLELVGSRSQYAVRAPAERDELLAGVAALYDDVADETGVLLPYVTSAFRAVRRRDV
jgi:SAM-dependent methyltransferase